MDREAELARLRAKLDARRGQSGFRENVREIERRIAEIEKDS